tara:strand:+ start:365 stop:637 length:273 start_codon:yes stop_codon:yes gene_type:complete
MKHNHIYYEKVEKAIRPHLEHYGEPWERREPLIQDVLDALFREPYNIVDWREREIKKLRDDFEAKSIKQKEQLAGYAVDHGVDTIGDERD